MTTIISGKEVALKLKLQVKEDIDNLVLKYGRRPKLSVILVGDDPGSQSYVKGKEKACNEVGIINETILYDSSVTEETLLKKIDELNNDDLVDGILVQLPLPKHISESRIIEAIDYTKDVDGFHPLNVAKLYSKQKCVLPCTPKGIIKLLDSENIEIEGKNAVVIGRSQIVGLPVSKLLLDRNATVTTCHSRTKNLKDICKKADILVVAIGKAKFVNDEFVNENQAVIDVGVNRNIETKKLCGDCDFDSINGKVKYLTKVPGGVGPMTIACLMENTKECYINHMEK